MNINLPGYGLDALQACRLEGGFIVAGWDCATELEPNPGFERSPFDLGLGWLVNLDASDFIGRDALLEQKNGGHPFTLRSFELNLEIAPEDGAVLYAGAGDNNASVGAVNCSGWSWGMKKTIGNASIKSDYADLEEAWLSLNGERVPVRLSRGPLINLERRSQVPASLEA
jgi:aminomethyltransferase